MYKMNLIIRSSILFLSMGIFPGLAFSQFSSKASIGAGAGITQMYGDISNRPIKWGTHLEMDYLLTPYISVGVQGVLGRLANNDSYGRDALNKYTGANVNIKGRLGLLMNGSKNYGLFYVQNSELKSILANIYLGAGVGFIHNDVDAYRGNTSQQNDPNFLGKDKSTAAVIPLNVGLDIPIGDGMYGPTWAINVNAQLGLYFGDDMDGYSNNYGNHNDRMAYLSIGVKKALFMK